MIDQLYMVHLLRGETSRQYRITEALNSETRIKQRWKILGPYHLAYIATPSII